MWEGLLIHNVTHFGGHLSQGLSNYPPDRICPGQRVLPGHKTLNAEPAEGRANADNWSPELLRCSEQQVKGLQSPSPHQQPQLLCFYLFLPTRLCLHFFLRKRVLWIKKDLKKIVQVIILLILVSQSPGGSETQHFQRHKSNEHSRIQCRGDRAKAAWMRSRGQLIP